MWVNKSYWGVQGFEITASGSGATCFFASPTSSSGPSIHHIIFANDIANGCQNSGFLTISQGSFGVDYFAVIGSIAYNSVQSSGSCFSGINITVPVQTDTLPGTHQYVAGNFTWDNVEPNPCNGGSPTDGQGITLDSWDVNSYTQQAVVANNISFLNGASGIRAIASTLFKGYILNNTTYGNSGGAGLSEGICGEIVSQSSANIEAYNNLSRTNAATACGGNKNYVFFVQTPCAGNVIHNNYGYSAAGNNTQGSSCSFSFGPNNNFGTDPVFANAPGSNPGAPSCGSSTSVPNCMATIIADFTPTTTAAKAYGYQPPSTVQTYDPLFPQWLCNVNLPTGLVTMGCVAVSSLPSSPTNIGVKVQ